MSAYGRKRTTTTGSIPGWATARPLAINGAQLERPYPGVYGNLTAALPCGAAMATWRSAPDSGHPCFRDRPGIVQGFWASPSLEDCGIIDLGRAAHSAAMTKAVFG